MGFGNNIIEMIPFNAILIIIFCWFKPIWADLKSCSDYEPGKLKLCLIGNGEYRPPFPLTVKIDINLREIVDIDKDKKSITTRLALTTHWTDPSLALTNDSIG